MSRPSPPFATRPDAALRLDFNTAPALLPACGFAAGIAAASLHWLVPAWVLLGALLLAGLALYANRHTPRLLPLALAALFLALGVLAYELQPPVDPETQLIRLADQRAPGTYVGQVVRVEAARTVTYTAFFQHTSRKEQAQRIDLRLRSVALPGAAMAPLGGGVRLTLYTTGNTPPSPLRCGTWLAVQFAPHAVQHFNDPGVWDASAWLLTQGIGATGTVEAAQAHALARGNARLPCLLHSLQTGASQRVLALADPSHAHGLPGFFRLNDEDASMLTAMLTGDRSALQQSTRLGFERTGAFHLLVVSGLHLAIFASVIAWLAKRCHLGRLVATAVTLVLSLGYALLTGFGAPVQRSLCMVTLYLLCRLLYRERPALQSLAITAIVLLTADARALGGASLQMTLLTVIAVGGIAVPLAQRTFEPYLRGSHRLFLVAIDPALPPRVAQWRVSLRMVSRHLVPVTGRWAARTLMPAAVRFCLRVVELAMVSAVVELVMALPMAVYFHRITVTGLPVNVLILPLLGLLLPAAMLTFLVQLALPFGAWVPAAVTATLLHTVAAVVRGFAASTAGDFRLPAPPASRLVPWLFVMAASVVAVRLRPRWAPPAGTALLAVAATLAVLPAPLRHRAGVLEVIALDVGQGDALLVISPEGRTLLVDAGGLVGESPGSRFDIGEDVVSPALWSRGIRRLDAVAITHGHADHIGGMPAVLANFRPRVLFVGNNPSAPQYDAVLAQARAQGIPVVAHHQGDRWPLDGETSVEAMWPSATYRPKVTPGNNDSLVLRLTYRHTSALLEGDAQALAEAGMVAHGLPHTDLLKVGHHGSNSSSTPAFLAALSPSWGVISCGRHNFYRHPRPSTLQHLEDANIHTLRTDVSGEEDFLLDGTTIAGAPWSPGVQPQ